MKPKTLVPLLIVLVVLGGLVLLRQAGDKPPSITEQVQLAPLLPEDLDADDVVRLELYAGAAPDDKLVLAKADSDEGWRVETHFDSPVVDTKIDEYLGDLADLKGEFRASTSGEEELAEYALTADTAFHVTGFTSDTEEPAFHVLVGKEPDATSAPGGYNNVFMRSDAGTDVYVANVNLRQKAGLYSDERSDPPQPNSWLDKTVAKLDKTAIRRIELTYPDKELVLENQEVPSEEPEQTAEAEAESGQEGEDIPPESEPVPEREWVVTEGGIDTAPKESGVTSLLNKLGSLSGTDIVDPAKNEEWHLAEPAYRATVTVEGQEEPVVIEGGRDPEAQDAYLRLASSDRDLVYKINRYGFEQLFPKGSALFDLPSLSLDSAEVQRIEYTIGDQQVVMSKQDDEWNVEAPVVDLPMQSSKPSAISSAVARWRAEDYADAADDRELTEPARRVGFTMDDGTTHTIAFGNKSKHFDGYYVQFDDHPRTLAANKAEITKIFVPPKDLYDRTIFDLDETQIASISVAGPSEDTTYSLANEEGAWTLRRGDETAEASQTVVDAMLDTLALLEATDIVWSGEGDFGENATTITFSMKDDTSHELVLGAETDEGVQAKASGKNAVFIVSEEDAEKIAPVFDTIRVAPPEPEEAEDETGESEGAEAPEETTDDAAAAPAEPSAQEPTEPISEEVTPEEE